MMKTQIMHLYGAGKVKISPLDMEEFKERKKAERMRRKLNKRPVRFKPGDKVGLLTLLQRVYIKGYFGLLHRGRWLVRCVCGVEFETTQKKLARGYEFSCGCEKRVRKQPVSTRPPNDIAGKQVGRLTPVLYETNKGWWCVCECGERELVRYSRDIKRCGERPCTHGA